MGNILQIAILIACISGAFFFALAEACLFSLGKWRGRRLARSSEISPFLSKVVSENTQETVSAVVLGNTLMLFTYLTVGLWLLFQGTFPLAAGLGILLSGALIAGEIIPKTLAVRNAEKWIVSLTPFLRLTLPVLRIFCHQGIVLNRWIMDRFIPSNIQPQGEINEEDYKELLDVAVRQKCLSLAEKEIILGVIRLDRMTARDVMRPRSQVLCLSSDYPENDPRLLQEARRLKRSRLPIYDENPDTIVGILNTKKLLLKPEEPLDEVMEFAAFIPETMNLWDLFQSLRRQGRGLAVALDEFGETAGIVTMSDILEEMVGDLELEEEESNERPVRQVSPGKWQAAGSCPLEDFHEMQPDFPYDEELDVETLNGLMIYQLEVVPRAGQSLVYGNYLLKATKVDDRRALEIEIEKLPVKTVESDNTVSSGSHI